MRHEHVPSLLHLSCFAWHIRALPLPAPSLGPAESTSLPAHGRTAGRLQVKPEKHLPRCRWCCHHPERSCRAYWDVQSSRWDVQSGCAARRRGPGGHGYLARLAVAPAQTSMLEPANGWIEAEYLPPASRRFALRSEPADQSVPSSSGPFAGGRRPIMISRLPTWLGAPTRPSFSMRSTNEAARL